MASADGDVLRYLAKTNRITAAAVEKALAADAQVVEPRFFVWALLTVRPVRDAIGVTVPLPNENDLGSALRVEPVAPPEPTPGGRTTTVLDAPKSFDIAELARDCSEEALRFPGDSATQAKLRVLRCLLSRDDESIRMLATAGVDTQALLQRLSALLDDVLG